MHLTLFAAFSAGLISFLSPCVLPLVPFYLAYLGGQMAEDEIAEKRPNVRMNAVFFVLGFSLVFIILGASASSLSKLLLTHQETFTKVAAAIIFIMGLHFFGVLKLGWLNQTVKFKGPQKAHHPVGAFIMGLAFAFGWTPCIGPILGAILSLAAIEENIAAGVMYLSAYALGLAVPFLILAFGLEKLDKRLKHLKKILPIMEKVMGGILILLSLLLITNALSSIAYFLINAFPFLAKFG